MRRHARKARTDSGGAYSDRAGAISDEILIFMRKMNREYDHDRERFPLFRY
ncbi:MAG: hypothetical protein LBS75_06400 [Synergistaceae bacterium]|nr:hypothetical protein [Synergistaceae bacterium]